MTPQRVAAARPSTARARQRARQGRRRSQASRTRRVKNYKIDDEVDRAPSGNPARHHQRHRDARAGRELPARVQAGIARGRNLDIINGAGARPAERRAASSSQRTRRSSACTTTGRSARTTTARRSPSARRAVHELLGYTGAGIGVAVIDSGITTWHDDLTNGASRRIYPYGNQRVTKFVDFVNGRTAAVRRQRPRHARRRHHRGQRLRLGRREGAASRPTRARLAQGARRQRRRARSATSSRRSTGWRPTTQTYNIRVVNMSVGARDSRVLLDRPADAGGQGASSTRASWSSPRPATRQERAQASCSTAASRRRPTRRGC